MDQDRLIVFFFPSYTLGGVQTLFVRLIKRLHEDGHKIGYVDFCNGTMRSALVHISDLKFIDFETINTNGSDIEFDSIVVTGFNFINLVSLFFSRNTHFLFWVLSPYNLPIKNLARKLKIKVDESNFVKRKYLGITNYKSALETESVYFMDSLCFEVNGEPDTTYDPYIPLYLDMPESEKFYDVASTTLNIAWVGRIDLSIKYHCVVYLIQKFELLKCNPKYENVTLTIVGEGAGSEKIREMCQKSPYSKSIKIKHTLPYNELYSYLLDNIDIVFAHGTTCLESASIAIPTVCLDGYMNKFRDDYKFKWLYSRKKYDIGRTEFGAEFSREGIHLEEIIEQLKAERRQVSKLSSDVISSQYAQDMLLKKFLDAIDRVETKNLHLKVNILTILIDSLVHWALVKKVFGRVLISYIKMVFGR